MNLKALILTTVMLGLILFTSAGAADEHTATYSVVEEITIDSTPMMFSVGQTEQSSVGDLREQATELLTVPGDELATDIITNIRFDSELTGLTAIFHTLEQPYTQLLGEAMYYILIFGIMIGLVWLASGSAKIPAVLGIGFSGFAMTFLPNAWQTTIFILIAVIVTTGIMYVWASRRETA